MGEPSPLPPHPALTRRQNEVAALVAAGLSNAQIAAALCIEYYTVKDHLKQIAERLDLPSQSRQALLGALYQEWIKTIRRPLYPRRPRYLFRAPRRKDPPVEG